MTPRVVRLASGQSPRGKKINFRRVAASVDFLRLFRPSGFFSGLLLLHGEAQRGEAHLEVVRVGSIVLTFVLSVETQNSPIIDLVPN